MNEPHKAVQEEELDALRAIFADDWEDIPAKKTAWGTEGEHGWWQVQLHATSDDRVRVKLKGRLTKNYPDQAPLLHIVDPVKITQQHVRDLTRLVEEKAKAAVGGGAMIFDLCDFIQGWLDDHHIPLPKPGEPEPTLMEEMALREKEQRAAEEAATAAQAEREAANQAAARRLLNQRIQEDASRKEERVRQAMIDQKHQERRERVSTLGEGEFEMRELVLNEAIVVEGYEGKWARWHVFGGHREQLWTSYTAEPAPTDTEAFVKVSTPTVTVQVVDFCNPYYNGQHGQKRIDTLVNELNRIKDVRSAHVQRLYAVERKKSPKGWERLIVVVERLPEAGRLRTWLPKEGFGEELAKLYLTQILSGLADLHRAHSMQKLLDCDFILLSGGEEDAISVKLSGTGYARRLVEYHRSNPFLKKYEEGYPESWLSPDEIDAPYSYSPKRDIWYAGLVLLQMLFGRNCLWTFPDLPTLLSHAPGGVSNALADLLRGLLNPVHKKRLTAEEGLSRLRAPEEELTHRPSSRSLPSMSVSGSGQASVASSFHPDMFGKSPGGRGGFYFPSTLGGSSRYSRYRADFEEVEFLGRGGFGEVVKAKNKLDGRPYAIKKVKLRPEDDVSRVLREVNSLSRVSHQYIVRYYSCWLEDVGDPDTPMDSTVPSTVNSSNVNSSNVSSESDIFAVKFDDFDKSMSRRDHSKSASFPRIRFADENDDDDESDDDDSSYDEESDDSDSDDSGWTSEHTVADPSTSKRKAKLQSKPQAITMPSKPPSKPTASFTGTTTDDDSVQRILYIQMEFVEKQTLLEAIAAGVSEDESWRLLVQMLQALAHMSSLGIVHRDLKPSNILLDANGNVKIADFGLSTTDLAITDLTPGPIMSSAENHDRTSNIGTSMYIAPEVLVSKSYNEKADMYSLGIMFFEMCYPFKTRMERADALTALRSIDIVFPTGWAPSWKPKQREIISMLLRHDPTMRPQATQLLSGPLVPTINKEEKYYDDVIAEITNPRSEKYLALIDALFETEAKHKFSVDNRNEDYTYDNEHDDTLFSWQVVVNGRIKKLFRRHGAVEGFLPLLMPETTLLRPFPERAPVRLLDSGGRFVQLPSSNLIGMARSTSREHIERIKRYVAAPRYSELPGGGQPDRRTELCFEIISPVRALAAEGELLELMDRVVLECQGLRASAHVDYEFHISHENILAFLVSTCPTQLRSRVIKAFKGPVGGVSFGQHSRPSIASIPGLSRNCLNDLERVSPVGEFEAVRRVIEETFPQAKRKLAFAFDEIADVIRFARSSGVKRKILFRPTLSKHYEYYRGGVMFECVRKGKQNEVLGYGGRHDSLLDHFKDPGTQLRRVHGVNMSISSDQLARMVRKQEVAAGRRLMNKTKVEERSFGIWAPTRCDVYVSSTSAVTIQERLAVTGQLWRAGIRADLQYDDGRTQQEVIEECVDQSILFMVIIRGHKDEAKVIRVLTGKSSEESVPEDKLVSWLKAAIEAQRRIDRAYAEGTTPVLKGGGGHSKEPFAEGQHYAARLTAVEINLVLPPEPLPRRGVKPIGTRKYRHATKSVYYEKADEFAASVKSTLPVIGVDFSPEFLSAMSFDSAWVTDDDAWRALTHNPPNALPTSERAYAEMVRRAVADHAKSPGGNVWLFSVREARGFLLQLSR